MLISGNLRVIVNYTKEGIPGGPDSMTVDKEGYLWIAIIDGASRVRYHLVLMNMKWKYTLPQLVFALNT